MAGTYTIRPGDTLWSIAARNNVTLSQLYQWNPEFLSNPKYQHGNEIWAGGVVNLGPSSPSSAPQPAAPAPAPAPAAPAPPAAPPSLEQTLLNELQGLPGSERDAYAAITTLFQSYGLQSLAPLVLTYLQDGFSSDTITVLLQETTQYQNRFAGNQARIANGLQVLTPAEYLATEASYRQALQAGGMDPGFMRQDQYAEWIGKDIAPTEIQTRVNLAVQATLQAPPSLNAAFHQLGMSPGLLASYFLNDQVPTPLLQQKLNQAQIMAADNAQMGLGTAGGASYYHPPTGPSSSGLVPMNPADALKYAQQGVTYAQAQVGFQHIADLLPTAIQLSDVYKSQTPYTQEAAQEEFLGNSGAAQLARENLGRQETAAFQGQGGVGKNSFTQQTAGAPASSF